MVRTIRQNTKRFKSVKLHIWMLIDRQVKTPLELGSQDGKHRSIVNVPAMRKSTSLHNNEIWTLLLLMLIVSKISSRIKTRFRCLLVLVIFKNQVYLRCFKGISERGISNEILNISQFSIVIHMFCAGLYFKLELKKICEYKGICKIP